MHVDLVEIAEQSTGRPPGPLAVAGGHQQLDRPSPAFRAAELHNMTLVLRRLAERVVCESGVGRYTTIGVAAPGVKHYTTVLSDRPRRLERMARSKVNRRAFPDELPRLLK